MIKTNIEVMTSFISKVLVTGAGGFIGNHLVSFLKDNGFWVRGVDIKYPEFGESRADEFKILDLREWNNCDEVTHGVDEVYALAADMGGMGFISTHNARIIYSNALMNFHTIEAAHKNGIKRIFYSSSACIYPIYRQRDANITPLKEEDAYPAEPEDAYGWEKLVTERLYMYYRQDYGIETRVARFHNIYGPYGTWEGGREKSPAAICRKVAVAKITGNHEIEVWGDGEQTRSYCYIDDCIEGIFRLMHSDHHEPLNIGQDRMLSINQLVDIVADIAGIKVTKKYVTGPQGVRGRNSDNTRLRQVLNWEPDISLEEGLSRTYHWIESQIQERINEKGGVEGVTSLAHSEILSN